MLILLILAHFWCSLVTSVTFSSNLSKFEWEKTKIPKYIKQKIQQNPKYQKISKMQEEEKKVKKMGNVKKCQQKPKNKNSIKQFKKKKHFL